MNKPGKIAGNSVIRLQLPDGMDEGIKRAKGLLLSGGVVAYPTESFYGLAVDATNEQAIVRLFSVKKRKPDRPVLILIPSVESLAPYVATIPPVARRLIREFWPGGLTIVFDSSSKVSQFLTAKSGKIGIRLSGNPLATALARSIGRPITGTSANVSGEGPCSTAKEVFDSLGDSVDLILDGGKTEGKIGSTVLDVTVDPPKILREGMVSREKLVLLISS